MRQRIYIAGPISRGDLKHNLQQARDAGLALLQAGFAPLIPHLTCFFANDFPELLPAGTTHEDWMAVDLPWVACADAILRLPGESKGADAEEALAKSLDIPVFYNVDDLIEAIEPDDGEDEPEESQARGQCPRIWRPEQPGDDSKAVAVEVVADSPPPPLPPKSPRELVLGSAYQAVMKERNNAYGPPSQDFTRTADMATALFADKLKFGAKFTAENVAQLVMLVKLSRLQWTPEHADSWVDIAGYAACGYEAAIAKDQPDEVG